MLTDQQWVLVEPLLPGKIGDRGRTGYNNRMALEGMLWIMRTGAPWRDMPARFGKWDHGVPAVPQLAEVRSLREDLPGLWGAGPSQGDD